MRDDAVSIISQNLSSLATDAALIDQKMLYELSELSEIAAAHIGKGSISLRSPYALADDMRRVLFCGEEREKSSIKEYLPFLSAHDAYLRVTMTAVFSAFLAERERRGEELLLKTVSAPQRPCIAYVPSPMAEIALEKISALSPGPSVLYVQNTEEACRAVTASAANYAIVPLSMADGERIAAMEKLTEQHHLRLLLTVRLYPDGENETLFGVFASDFYALAEQRPLLDIRFTADSYFDLAHVYSAFSLLGFSLYHHRDALDDYGRVGTRVTVGGGDVSALGFFLSLITGDFELLGSYALI